MVDHQKAAIDKQKEVIKSQDEKIVVLEDRVEELDTEADAYKGTSVISIILTLLIVLL